VYAAPETPWLRVNMVSTIDGAATGESGLTASINNEPDQRVFRLLRELADCVVIGAGTARTEGYPPLDVPTVVVSRSGSVPEKMRGADPGRVLLATVSVAAGLEDARDVLGADNVLVLGSHRVDLAALKQALVDRGFGDILCEGGPHLLRDLLAQGVADELDCTFVPRMVAGVQSRITDGPPVDVALTLHTLVEQAGTLLGRWFTR
jgi:riboflavin biosynthesis pyrimidine reductase